MRGEEAQMARYTLLLAIVMPSITIQHTAPDGGVDEAPRFVSPIENVTVPLGRDARLSCVVENLGNFRVAWIYKGTGGRTVLTVATQVITKNQRISATQEAQAWVLTVTNLTKKDQGVYMCQVNTKPVTKQIGYIRVVVPPTIDDTTSSSDMTVNEGSDVVMTCDARGDPQPTIRWVREDGRRLTFTESSVAEHMGGTLSLGGVGRNSSGAYLCIATNGVPPSVSKRIILNVNFPPVMVGGGRGGRLGVAMEGVVSLECRFHARPLTEVTWFHGPRELTPEDTSVTINTTSLEEDSGLWRSVLSVQVQGISDFGQYSCVVQNPLGTSDRTFPCYCRGHHYYHKHHHYHHNHQHHYHCTLTAASSKGFLPRARPPPGVPGPARPTVANPGCGHHHLLPQTRSGGPGEEEKETEERRARTKNQQYHTQLSFGSFLDLASSCRPLASSSWLVTCLGIIVSLLVTSSS